MSCGKQGRKRSVVVEACGVPLDAMAAPANRRDGLLAATLETVAMVGSPHGPALSAFCWLAMSAPPTATASRPSSASASIKLPATVK